MTGITYEEAVEQFREGILPLIVFAYEGDGVPDYPARSEAWSNFVDGLVTDMQASIDAFLWEHPDECWAPWER